MAVKDILRMGHPLLRERAVDVTEAQRTGPELAALVADMVDTLDATGRGIGLAAPQIGVSLRVAIIQVPGGASRYGELETVPLTVYVNPVIEVLDPTLQSFWEGCLSVPGLRGYVPRPRAIRVSWTDLDGSEQAAEYEGFLATIFQHEFDHLDGVLYVDRLADTRRLVFEDEFDRWLTGDPEAAPPEAGEPYVE
ncbi:MAG TPA: peptide deformylase [Pseudomonadales bacterium]|nr:peptide deformylase [Pseudomonadales bacterium]